MNKFPHSANGRVLLILQVPSGATQFEIRTECGDIFLCYNSENATHYNKLPKGAYSYTVLFVAEEATEDQAGGVVEYQKCTGGEHDDDGSYKNYVTGFFEEYYSTMSLESLVRSRFPKSNIKHLILEIL